MPRPLLHIRGRSAATDRSLFASGIFQSLMELLLQGLDGVAPYFDDILIAVDGRSDLVVKLQAILLRFCKAGIRLK